MAADGEDPDPSEIMSKLEPGSTEFREALRSLTRSVTVTGSASPLYLPALEEFYREPE